VEIAVVKTQVVEVVVEQVKLVPTDQLPLVVTAVTDFLAISQGRE
jgi:hypothetical protein